MMWRQHRGFKSRLIAVLFLFFNCVCAAAPAAKLSDDNFKDAISLKIGSPLQAEEETHVASGYINQAGHFTVRKQSIKQNFSFSRNEYTAASAAVESSNTYIANTGALPLPGNYTFLFRYNLF